MEEKKVVYRSSFFAGYYSEGELAEESSSSMLDRTVDTLGEILMEVRYLRYLLEDSFEMKCKGTVLVDEEGNDVDIAYLVKNEEQITKMYNEDFPALLEAYRRGERPMPTLHKKQSFDEWVEGKRG